jgi:hypothetical protein
MPKGRSLEAKLAGLRGLRGEPLSPELLHELRGALRDASNVVVAEAAEMAAAAHFTDLVPDLVEAYERFLDNPVKKDKLCRAKIAIAQALNNMEFLDEGFYLRGVHYMQLEPAWGGAHDTAVPVRVACAFGLVRLRHRGALSLLVDLLAEPDKAARVGAVQALTYAGTEAAGLLLRLKCRLGDAEPEVISECFSGLLELTPEQAVTFVAEFLASHDEAIREAALLALGSSRRPEAFEILKSHWEKSAGELQDVVLMSMALLRQPAATDFLLSLVADQSQVVAAAALAALAVQRYDTRVRDRAAAAVAKNGHAALRALFDKRFAASD